MSVGKSVWSRRQSLSLNEGAAALIAVILLLCPPHASAQENSAADSIVAAARAVRDSAMVRVCAGGDVTLGTNLDTAWVVRARKGGERGLRAFPDPDSLLAPLRPLVSDADILLINVEGAIGEGVVEDGKCRPESTMCYAFRQPPRTAAAIRRLGGATTQVIGNVANNHARDAGDDGLLETRRLLELASVSVTGMDTIATPVVTGGGDTVAFLGYSPSGGPDPRDLDAVKRQVARAAARWPRLVVTMHMGAEGAAAQRTPDSTEIFIGIDRGNAVAFARAAAESGADLVVGHGPHVMRGAEWWWGTLIAYSLGNLVTYGPFTLTEPLNRGGLLCADLDDEGRVADAVFRATWQIARGRVRPDPQDRASILADSLSRLDFPQTGAAFVRETRILRQSAASPPDSSRSVAPPR
jgi:hypothetical protein